MTLCVQIKQLKLALAVLTQFVKLENWNALEISPLMKNSQVNLSAKKKKKIFGVVYSKL